MTFKTFKTFIGVFAIVVLAGCASSKEQGQPYNEQTLATKAANTLQHQMQSPPSKRIPDALINGARCIAVFPSVTQAAFIVGGKHGSGIVSCRKPGAQGWSDAAPAFYTLSGGSIGFQAGAQQSNLILLFLTRNAVNQLMHGSIKFGADVGIVAGPVGYNANVQSNPAPIVSYQSSSGLFAGISLNGSNLSYDTQSNQNVYGRRQGKNERRVLFQINQVPRGIDVFNQQLDKFAPNSKAHPLSRGSQ